MNCNEILQHNASTIKLLINGRESLCKRVCHFDARIFHAKDLIRTNEVKVKNCLAEKITANRDSKPLVSRNFKMLIGAVMSLSVTHPSKVR